MNHLEKNKLSCSSHSISSQLGFLQNLFQLEGNFKILAQQSVKTQLTTKYQVTKDEEHSENRLLHDNLKN